MDGRHERRAAAHPPHHAARRSPGSSITASSIRASSIPASSTPALSENHLGDQALAALARDGDSAATGELYRRHFATTMRCAARWASHAHSAEDLASEAFVGMLLALRQGGGPSENVAAYLRVAVRNAAHAHHRRGLHPAAPMLAEAVQLERRAVAQHSALEELLARESAEVVDAVLGRLQPRWREVLVLTFLDELSGPDVALRLGISVPAARALRYRARRGFTQAFAEAMRDAAILDSSGPDHAASDRATPDGAAPDHAAPDRAAPDHAAPDDAAPDESRPGAVSRLRAGRG